MPEDRLRVLTWHVHGSYLYYLAQTPHEFYLPVTGDGTEGYGGKTPSFPWPGNVHEVPAGQVRDEHYDVVLFQSHRNWLVDQYELLSEEQRRGPRVYLEHDPPREHPTDTRHPVRDDEVLIVHVTPFNALMWDNGPNRVRVVEHGVIAPPEPLYLGEKPAGIAVVNNIVKRGRRLGLDVLQAVRRQVPIDLVGMGSTEAGGLGEVPLRDLPEFQRHYRFFFNPIRYTSLGLAVCEAMAAGMPVIGLATTEMSTAVTNGVTGWVDTDVNRLVQHMQRLLAEPEEAARLGLNARAYAMRRFGMERFADDWTAVLREAAAVGVVA
jgi:glycosyltransferase involved in cell wall biosynthesis